MSTGLVCLPTRLGRLLLVIRAIAAAKAMLIRTSAELALRFRSNALECELAASKDLRSQDRDRLLNVAKQYRLFADKITFPSQKIPNQV